MIFKVYNLAGDGLIKKAELLTVVRTMVGPETNFDDEQLVQMVEDTFEQADLNRDGYIDRKELQKGLVNSNILSSLSFVL